MSREEAFVQDLKTTLPNRGLANAAATQLLLTDPWPSKFVGWRSSTYVIDDPGWTGFNFDEIREGLTSGDDGPWNGCSSGEMRVLLLACLIAEDGALSDNLSGIRYEQLQAARIAITSLIDDHIRCIDQWRARVGRTPGSTHGNPGVY